MNCKDFNSVQATVKITYILTGQKYSRGYNLPFVTEFFKSNIAKTVDLKFKYMCYSKYAKSVIVVFWSSKYVYLLKS